jgi:hypothetical protein
MPPALPVVFDFILNHHKLISRYEELQARETRKRAWFTFISLTLLLVIPYIVFLISSKESILAPVTGHVNGLTCGS